ncbi:MAG: hypothetical protein AAGN66_23525, partial [Acidobacteriota bacterium]
RFSLAGMMVLGALAWAGVCCAQTEGDGPLQVEGEQAAAKAVVDSGVVVDGSPTQWTEASIRKMARDLAVVDWRLEAGTGWQPEASAWRTIGHTRRRRMSRALFQLHLHSGAQYLDRDLYDQPEAFDEVKDAVLSGFVKLQRERLEDYLDVEGRLDRFGDRMTGADKDGRDGSPRPLWRLRISPRVSVGDKEYVGFRFKLRHAHTPLWERFSMRVRYDFIEDRPVFAAQFEDRDRYFGLTLEPGTHEQGDRVLLGVRMDF